MENKNRGKGFHVTIVDNNTGETIRDFDTRAIDYIALMDTKEGKKIMEERNPLAGCGLTTLSMADEINIMQAYAIVDGLQRMLQHAFEEHPEFELFTKLLDCETFDIDTKED